MALDMAACKELKELGFGQDNWPQIVWQNHVEPAWMAWRCYGSDYVFGQMERKRLMGWDVVPFASKRPKPRGAVLAWAMKVLE